MRQDQRNTDRGRYMQDKSGLWHYEHTQGSDTVEEAAADALKHRPVNGAAWFWFRGTPSPIHRKSVGIDTTEELVSRWREWHNTCETGHEGALLTKLMKLMTAR